MARRDLRRNTLPFLIGKVVLSTFFRLYCPMRIEGEDNVPSEGPFILVSNHASNIDPLAIGFACHREISFLSKQELFRIPVVSYFIRQWGMIPFDRSGPDASAIRAALRTLQESRILGIFPEATRSPNGELQAFRQGVAKIALHSGVSIIPVALLGTYGSMPRGSHFPRPAHITVRFGKPFRLHGSKEPKSSPHVLLAATLEIRDRVSELLQARYC